MKVSPAPTVSTTSVRRAGTSMPTGPVASVTAQGPISPRVTTTMPAPLRSHARADSWRVEPG